MTRVAIYARYSSDNQRDASIEDQVRLCRERAEKEGWKVINVYSDHAISGSSLMRPAVQMLMQDANAGKFDVIIAEAMDRLSRDQENIAGLFKRLQFAGVRMFTLSEGEVSSLHIGLKGTMNALFLKDLADKTRRGLRGRVEQGKSGGGLTFGYDVVKRVADDGEYARGERTINEDEAAVVRRIFSDYVAGHSPRSIAMKLNQEGVAGPLGGQWGASTIYGNRQRGTGILNNELYLGVMVWNRLRYIKDPDTGKRVPRLNPEEEWIRRDVPELQIVDQDLWDATKRLQGDINAKGPALWQKNRPKNLFSNLIKCGCCGGGFSMVGERLLGCSTARNKGTCSNRMKMKREDLERAVLGALTTHLMDEKLCEEFCQEYTKRMNELHREHNAALSGYRRELQKLERERQQIVQSICDGVPGHVVKDRAIYVQSRKEELEEIIASTKEVQIIFHPNMANRYHKEVRNLLASLSSEDSRIEAANILRSLIDRIVLTPSKEGDRLVVDLNGDLAGILAIATKQDRPLVTSSLLKLKPVQQAADGANAKRELGLARSTREAVGCGERI